MSFRHAVAVPESYPVGEFRDVRVDASVASREQTGSPLAGRVLTIVFQHSTC
jgi:hypothetical protein